MTEEKVLSTVDAQGLLRESFSGQRPLNERYVRLWAEEMRRGEFRPQTQIRIAICDGRQYLIDGQHRLSAQVLAGVSLSYTVTWTECENIQDVGRLYSVIDRGQTRTIPQILTAQDIDLGELANIGPGLLTVMNSAGVWIESGFSKRSNQISYQSRSEDQLVRRVSEWGGALVQYYAAITGKSLSSYAGKKAKHVGVVAAALLQYRYCRQNADEFWCALASDDGLKRGDPRKTLLRAMEEDRWARHSRERWFSGSVLAWNAWVEGRELLQLKSQAGLPAKFNGLVDCPFWR